jgi:hypothetical protein
MGVDGPLCGKRVWGTLSQGQGEPKYVRERATPPRGRDKSGTLSGGQVSYVVVSLGLSWQFANGTYFTSIPLIHHLRMLSPAFLQKEG